jgi:hypothetical protein
VAAAQEIDGMNLHGLKNVVYSDQTYYLAVAGIHREVYLFAGQHKLMRMPDDTLVNFSVSSTGDILFPVKEGLFRLANDNGKFSQGEVIIHNNSVIDNYQLFGMEEPLETQAGLFFRADFDYNRPSDKAHENSPLPTAQPYNDVGLFTKNGPVFPFLQEAPAPWSLNLQITINPYYANDAGQVLVEMIIGLRHVLMLATPATASPTLTLTRATTTNGQNVVLDYGIASGTAQPIHFEVYRSDQTTETTSSVRIGESTISNPADLSQGNHSRVVILSDAPLVPNTALPYVVVVTADPYAGQTVYFRKSLLGVIVHGYDPLPNVGLFSTPTWMTDMEDDLRAIDHYDDVITFNWEPRCATPESGMTTMAAESDRGGLAMQIIEKLLAPRGHDGDVIDLHFIGHSRGAIVVTAALQLLVAGNNALISPSYIK